MIGEIVSEELWNDVLRVEVNKPIDEFEMTQVDLVLNGRLVVELNGPFHYKDGRPLIKDVRKRDIIEQLGYTYFVLDYHVWSNFVTDKEQKEFLRDMLEEAIQVTSPEKSNASSAFDSPS